MIANKILLIHHRLPYPIHSGMDKARYSLIKLLNTRYQVTLIVLSDSLNSKDEAIVKSICSELIIVREKNLKILQSRLLKKIRTSFLLMRSLFFGEPIFISNIYSKHLKKEIKHLLATRDFNIIQPLSDFSMNYVYGIKTKGIKFYGPNDDMVGMSESILAVTENKWKRLLLKIELQARKRWQEKMIRDADKICYFSKKDIERIITCYNSVNERIIWMPGVIEYENQWDEKAIYTVEKNTMVFTGGLVSEFNKLSLIYFLKEIWPLILRMIPDAKLFVVGQTNSDEFQTQFSFPNVIYTGRVESVVPYLERASVFISPVICGTGIKTKIVEALRFGKAIVTTSQGVSGLWETPPDVLKIKSSPKEFASEVLELLSNNNYRIETCLKSRKLFEDYYSIEKVTPAINKIYEQIFGM